MIRYMLIFCVLVAACGSQAEKILNAPAKSEKATIVRVVDGDTLVVSIDGKQKTVRLIGIDTPETHKPGVKVECGGRQASTSLRDMAPAGAEAKLVSDPSQDEVDRYGRLLAYVTVGHERLQLEQINSGWAKVYVYGGKPFARVDSYRRAQSEAKRADRGVWGSCGGDFHSEDPDKR